MDILWILMLMVHYAYSSECNTLLLTGALQQKAVEGQYEWFSYCFNVVSFRHENLAEGANRYYYLYFYGPSSQGWRGWIVSKTPCSDYDSVMQVTDEASHPLAISNMWKERDMSSGDFFYNPEIHIECTESVASDMFLGIFVGVIVVIVGLVTFIVIVIVKNFSEKRGQERGRSRDRRYNENQEMADNYCSPSFIMPPAYTSTIDLTESNESTENIPTNCEQISSGVALQNDSTFQLGTLESFSVISNGSYGGIYYMRRPPSYRDVLVEKEGERLDNQLQHDHLVGRPMVSPFLEPNNAEENLTAVCNSRGVASVNNHNRMTSQGAHNLGFVCDENLDSNVNRSMNYSYTASSECRSTSERFNRTCQDNRSACVLNRSTENESRHQQTNEHGNNDITRCITRSNLDMIPVQDCGPRLRPDNNNTVSPHDGNGVYINVNTNPVAVNQCNGQSDNDGAVSNQSLRNININTNPVAVNHCNRQPDNDGVISNHRARNGLSKSRKKSRKRKHTCYVATRLLK